jgi:O-antigen/teichoic acid export membrane protein
MAPTIVASVLPVITLPLFTRALSREEYGLWGIASAFAAVLSGSLGLGLQIGYERNYFAATEERSRARLLYSVVLFAAGLQAAGLFVVAAFGPMLAAWLMDQRGRWTLFILAFGLTAMGTIKAFFLTTLRNEGRAADYARFSVDELFLGATLSVVCVLWLRIGVAGLIVGPLVAAGSVLLVLLVRFAPRAKHGFDRQQLRDTLRISLPLAPRMIVGAAGNQLDKLVLGAIGSLAGVGVYTVGQRMAQFVFAFMTAIQNVYQPRVYRLLFANAHPRDIGNYLMPFAYASAGIAFGVIVFADDIVRIVAPAEYAPASIVLAILSVHYGLMFFGKQPQLVFAKRTDIISVLSIASVALSAGGVYAGARAGGSTGAAIGLLAAGILSGGVGLVAANRLAPIAYPVRRTAIIFLSLPLALLLVTLLRAASLPFGIVLVVKVAAVAGFALMGWHFGAVTALLHPGAGQPPNASLNET